MQQRGGDPRPMTERSGETRDPTLRFSDRVANYTRYRPSYPAETIDVLVGAGALSSDDVVADIGSGTGKLTELFLRHGHTVFGVEPNAEMREAGERALARFPGFHSVDGRAEATGLAPSSVDVIAAGQALHWFDLQAAAVEFRRVARPGARMVIVWNDRNLDASPFMTAYEELLRRHGTDYELANHQRFGDGPVEAILGDSELRLRRLSYTQRFDLPGLRGRLVSSSYTPASGEPGHEAMLRDLDALFDAHQHEGQVQFVYVTRVYHGRLSRGT